MSSQLIEEVKKLVIEQFELLITSFNFRVKIEDIVESVIERRIIIAKTKKEEELSKKAKQTESQTVKPINESENYWNDEKNTI